MARSDLKSDRTKIYFDQLKETGNIEFIDAMKFKELIEIAYKKAVFTGVKRIGIQSLRVWTSQDNESDNHDEISFE
jgi:hypothetical protein